MCGGVAGEIQSGRTLLGLGFTNILDCLSNRALGIIENIIAEMISLSSMWVGLLQGILVFLYGFLEIFG
jgi:hypothetical protein